MSLINDLINHINENAVPFIQLRNAIEFKNGKGHEQSISNNGGFIVVNSKFISTDGEVFKCSETQICPVFKDDILMVMSDLPNGRALAKCFIVDCDDKYTLNQRIGCFTNVIREKLDNKFLYYVLNRNSQLLKYDNGVDQTNLRKDDILDIKIPVPPMEVQCEIVRILDSFTELTAELTARRKQFKYYVDYLFKSGKNIKNVTLPEISTNMDSKRKPITSSLRVAGPYPYYGASGIVDYVEGYIFDGDYLLVSEDGANLLARVTPIAFSISGKNWVNNHAHILKFDNYYTRRYVEMYLNSIDLSFYISGAAQPKLNQDNLNKIQIPLPDYGEQKRIVDLLDLFDHYSNHIEDGLPAEIEARQKQYEYYRDKLLSFKELQS